MRTAETSMPLLHFQSRSGMLNHTGGTRSYGGMVDYPRIPKTELHLVKFPDPMENKAGRSTSRLKFCTRTADPQINVLWIKEVEVAKSSDELVTSRWITRQHKFLDFDVLDAMIASTLKKLINTQSTFRERVSVEEQRAINSDRFLRGKQNAFMIYEYFRATGAYEAEKGLADLVSMTLQNDDVQDFDVRGYQGLLSVSEMPSVSCLGRIVQVKISEFRSTSACDGIV